MVHFRRSQNRACNDILITSASSKRNRNTLTENSRDRKVMKVSQAEKYFLGTCGRLDTAENAVIEII